ncbi:MAG: 16S rRNA (cytosine(1402)-N(4))-methyltransferase RsmH [Pyrinomonadaceae bacterium]
MGVVQHRPVLLHESLEWLAPSAGIYVDGTLGLGGHSEAILGSGPDISVIGIDRDTEAIASATTRLGQFGSRFQAVHGDFRDLATILETAGIAEVQGILVDLGVSSLQFDAGHRGFSFRTDAPLDMRMDATSSEPTAADLLAELPEEEIARIIFVYGEERRSRKIARWIVERRERGEPVTTTQRLAELVARAVGKKRSDHIHPATRTFQALRIAVNRELDQLAEFFEAAVRCLAPNGRIVAISFHSLEDRIVKQTFRRLSGKCECPPRAPFCACGARREVEILTRRPVVPGPDEIEANPRSRSAKLRAVRKL